MNRPQSTKIKNNGKKYKSKVRFTDQVVLLDSIKDSDVENVRLLLRRRSACIDIGLINNSGLTALHHAVLENSLDLVKLLVENNANINCLDEDLWTPLHTAASMGYYEVSKYLLQHGADTRALTQENLKPIDLIEKKDSDLISLFRHYMNLNDNECLNNQQQHSKNLNNRKHQISTNANMKHQIIVH